MAYEHRNKGFKLLKGHGLEIGALHEPASIPSHCKMTYADAISKEKAKELFPEIDGSSLVEVDVIVDLDKGGLQNISDCAYDFTVLNHVIEHVANPINVVAELFRVTKDGGKVVIAAPDKRFTFDKDRSLTSFEHLKEEFENKVTDVTDEHYIDFLKHVHPNVMDLPEEKIHKTVQEVKARREHAHVWDSHSFRDFLKRSVELLKLECGLQYESLGDDNKIEYFSVWQKGVKSKRKGLFGFLKSKPPRRIAFGE